MRRSILHAGAGWVLAFALAAGHARAATPAEIDAAIAKGQAFLLSQMKAPGRWEPEAKRRGHEHDWPRFQGDTWGGYTAIATYALLASGKSPQDAQLAAAVKFLKTADISGVYALGMRAQVWTFLPQTPETKQLFAKDAAAILRTLNTKGRAAGLWDYDDLSPAAGRIDHSVSQFGVLGLWACAQGGATVDPKLWATFDDAWKGNQHDDGGWSYDGGADEEGKPSTHTMTAAGIATLFITQEFLPSAEGINCKGNPPDEEIDNALRWMSDNFADVKGNNYLWYSIERIGAASGRKYFGGQDWYAAGARDVLRSQLPNGSWKTKFSGASPVPDTALALLFLARGRAPIVMNKLDTGISGDWNQRPRDVANVTRWIGRQGERYLSWQVVDLGASAQDLLDAPILYLSGSSQLPLGEAEVAKLRQFVEDGGLILGNADCGKKAFAESFRRLGEDMFPAYAFRELPPTHPILAGQQFRADKWKEKVSIQGMSNGSRELMLLLPSADAGRAWQQRAERPKETLFQLAANVYLYATDKWTDRQKGQTHVVKDLGATPTKTVKVARLDVGGNWDPEPGGWRRLALVMKNEPKVGLEVTPVKLAESQLARASGFQVAHLTGTEPFMLNDVQRDELKQFVFGGGTLVIDAAGGSAAFADSIEKELVAIFGDAAAAALKAPVAPDHALFTNPAAPIKRVGYRRTLSQRATGDLKGPRLRGIAIENRIGVIFSREDLSTGMVGHAVDGVAGYDPASATAIMRNVILYAVR